MPILSEEDRDVIKNEYFDKMKNDVDIYFFWSEDERNKYRDVILLLLKELEEMSNKITVSNLKFNEANKLVDKFNVSYSPCIVLSSKIGRLKYYGVPAGQEFSSFLKAIVMVSTGRVELDKDLEEFLRRIDEKVEVKIFITLPCPYCPLMVETAYIFALKSKNIDVEVIEAEEFLDEAKKYEVHAVPKIVINERIVFEGLVPPKALAMYISKAIEMERS